MDARIRQNGASVLTPLDAEEALPDVTALVRVRAYELFRMRIASGLAGDAVSDWAQAEREIASAPLIALIDSEIEPSLGDARMDLALEMEATGTPGYEIVRWHIPSRGAP